MTTDITDGTDDLQPQTTVEPLSTLPPEPSFIGATMDCSNLKAAMRSIPDFPKPGIIFRDITPVLADPRLLRQAVSVLIAPHRGRQIKFVAAIDARGFILGGAAAVELGAGFIPIRKKGKLPYKTIEESYDLEYGSATLTVHIDALQPGDNVLLMDDLLATGGTAAAAVRLLEKLGGKVAGVEFLVELPDLHGRAKLAGYPVRAAMAFEGD